MDDFLQLCYQSLYDTNFPIEFRHYFAEIIERQPWDQIDPDQEWDKNSTTQKFEPRIFFL